MATTARCINYQIRQDRHPATTENLDLSSFKTVFARARARVRRWIQLSRQRRELAGLSDAILKDIGLSRADALREAARPFWDDPASRG